jgi:hypothetical protein
MTKALNIPGKPEESESSASKKTNRKKRKSLENEKRGALEEALEAVENMTETTIH